jgi:hypothetical protein
MKGDGLGALERLVLGCVKQYTAIKRSFLLGSCLKIEQPLIKEAIKGLIAKGKIKEIINNGITCYEEVK